MLLLGEKLRIRRSVKLVRGFLEHGQFKRNSPSTLLSSKYYLPYSFSTLQRMYQNTATDE